jgi:hypothetical protein
MFAYVGLGPGQEFIPYFLALLAFVWAAAIAILQWPFLALIRLIRGRKSRVAGESTNPAPAALTNESPNPLPSSAVTEAPRDIIPNDP